MKLNLYRDTDNGESTLGRLYADDEFIAYTLENTYIDNKKRISCIPPGQYELTTKEYGRFYDKIKKPIPILKDVPNRSEILIHWGNYPKDTLGCILVGDGKGENAVWNSRKTFDKLHPIFMISSEIEIHKIS